MFEAAESGEARLITGLLFGAHSTGTHVLPRAKVWRKRTVLQGLRATSPDCHEEPSAVV
jgi:hypothetical protein